MALAHTAHHAIDFQCCFNHNKPSGSFGATSLRKGRLILSCNGQPYQRSAALILFLINPCTFLEAIKLFLRFVRVAVDLPASDAFGASRLVLNKALDVLARITKEQSDLMREIIILTDSLHQLNDALLTAFGTVAVLRKKITYSAVAENLAKLRWTINIDQRFVLLQPKRYQSNALAPELGIPLSQEAENLSLS